MNLYLADILEQLNIMDTRNNNNNNTVDLNTTGTDTDPNDSDDVHYGTRRSNDERALAPRVSSMENSLIEHLNGSVPSLDEIVIRQRGRKKQPAKISWSPVKSPFKTPTKSHQRQSSSSLHMSLLSPSPAKKLFHNTSMTLRSSPRKRILVDTPPFSDPDPTSSSTPLASTPTKRLKFVEDRPMNATNLDVPIRTLLKGLNQDQLIKLICDVSSKEPSFRESVRKNLPLPDIQSYEEQLVSLRKNITKSSPRSRLLSRTDEAAFSRASPHLVALKKLIVNHCKILNDSQHFDALIDYILMSWNYVRALPIWDDVANNILRRDCFKALTMHARLALKNGGMKLGAERIANFHKKLKPMMGDFQEIGKCQDALKFLSNK